MAKKQRRPSAMRAFSLSIKGASKALRMLHHPLREIGWNAPNRRDSNTTRG
jgi:hypothetical protein